MLSLHPPLKSTQHSPLSMRASSLTDAELSAWLALATAPGLTSAAVRALLDALETPEKIRAASFAELTDIAGSQAARAALAEPAPEFAKKLATVLAWRAHEGNEVLTLGSPAYPTALTAIHDPPPLLYVKGSVKWLQTPAIALVGSRNATPQGLEDAAHFAHTLAEAGLTIVSGLARGIDGAAHRGALGARGSTVAITGTGADIIYPAKHHALACDIAEHGAIVSEWPLGAPARAAHFPQRNRLIAGLVKGVLVVEAALRSGSLITARLANEMGRDVFAIPGSIHAPLSQGCHQLIKEGAKLVETPTDIFDELGITPTQPGLFDALPSSTTRAPFSPADAGLSQHAAQALDALGHAPATLEMLSARTRIDSASLQSTLLQLELAGQVSTLPGGRFARIVRVRR